MRQIALCALKDLYLYRYRWRSASVVCRLLFLLLRYYYSLRIVNINFLFLSILKMGNPALFIKVKRLTDDVLISLLTLFEKSESFIINSFDNVHYYPHIHCEGVKLLCTCISPFPIVEQFWKNSGFECFLTRRKKISVVVDHDKSIKRFLWRETAACHQESTSRRQPGRMFNNTWHPREDYCRPLLLLKKKLYISLKTLFLINEERWNIT